MRIALLSGVYVAKDAISASLGAKLEALDTDPAGPHDLRVFVHGSDALDPRVEVVHSVADLLVHPFFRTCDVVSYEFGITYGLFDSIFLAAQRAAVVVTYHNLTPLQLVDDPQVRAALLRSAVQRHALTFATHVINDSASNYRDLLQVGLPAQRMSVVALPPGPAASAFAPGEPARGRIELLYVGRLVRAKGVYDLLEAFASVRGHARLTFVGSPAFSDPQAITDLEEAARAQPGRLRFVPGPTDEELAQLYRASHALVMPSYHEGYCVPVMEALASGCHVIAYDNSNLPETLDGLGRLVDTGDVVELGAAMDELVEALSVPGEPQVDVEAGRLTRTQWLEAARELVSSRSAEVYARQFLDRIAEARRTHELERSA